MNPFFFSAVHSAGGMGALRHATICATSSALFAPTTVDATAGWSAGNCSAASLRRDPERLAHLPQVLRALQDIGGCTAIVVHARRCRPRCQQAGVEYARRQELRSASCAEVQQTRCQRRLFQQRVAAGQEDAVERRAFEQLKTHVAFIHANADPADQTFVPRGAKRGQSFVQHLLQDGRMRIAMRNPSDVMDQRDIDMFDAKPREASFQAAAHAILRIVETRTKRQRIGIAEIALLARRDRIEHAADLGRQERPQAAPAAKCFTDPLLAAAMAVVGRGVEIEDAGGERGVNRCNRLRVAQRPIQIADRCTAQPKDRHVDFRVAVHGAR